jgi:hypothetical protein
LNLKGESSEVLASKWKNIVRNRNINASMAAAEMRLTMALIQLR